ncbi:MAG: GxxExxY protein [Myxococcota bacterium]
MNTPPITKCPNEVPIEAEGPEAWRMEVDRIIAAIHARPAEPCSATLAVPTAPEPEVDNFALARTEPNAPCAAALEPPAPFALEIVPDSMVQLLPESMPEPSEQATTPAHPVALESLRAACERNRAMPADEHAFVSGLPPSPLASQVPVNLPGRGAALVQELIQAATEVHRCLGPGLPERVYQQCFAHELGLRGLRVAVDVPISLSYKGDVIAEAFRAAMIVENSVLIDVKAVCRLEPAHEAHFRTYCARAGVEAGVLINFHEAELEHGVRTAGVSHGN